MKATYMAYVKKEPTLICKDRKSNLLKQLMYLSVKKWQKNVNKIIYRVHSFYTATFNLVRNSLSSTVVFYNFEISLSSASTTIYLFV